MVKILLSILALLALLMLGVIIEPVSTHFAVLIFLGVAVTLGYFVVRAVVRAWETEKD